MGAQALLWPPLLLALLTALLGQAPGAQAQGCSVRPETITMEENSNITEALANFTVSEGYHVALGPLSTPSTFRIEGNQLFLTVIPDYEENSVLQAQVECRRGDTVVTYLRVLVIVLDINDNAPEFPFTIKKQDVEEDTKVNTIVIPEEDLTATDKDKNDILFYTLQEVTPGTGSYFSLLGVNNPALRLDRALDYYKWQNMTFQLLVRDTRDEYVEPSHTATATLVLNVLPADLRPPWFLPCSYTDGYVCIEAQYQGTIPTAYKLPSPLILSPGPIYAVDGDRGINQPIIYSLMSGNTDNTFAIDADSGNLTMTKSVPSPTIFRLVVKGEQADLARYSVTQVTVEARQAIGSPPRFSQSVYRGTVTPGSGPGVTVMDAASPSQPLRIWAEDPEFPDLNSEFTYQITNCSEFQMDGEAVLTTVAVEQAGVFYAEVEARNNVTTGTATTVAEIHVTEPTSTGTTLSPPTSPTPEVSPSMGVGTSPGPATPNGGSAQTQKPGTSPTTVPTAGTGTSPGPATPNGGSAQTQKPGTSPTTVPTAGTGTSPGPAMPNGGSAQTQKPGTSPTTVPTAGMGTSPGPAMPDGGSVQTQKPGTSPKTTTAAGAGTSRPTMPSEGSAQTLNPGTSWPTASEKSPEDDRRFSIVDMAVLGGVLGALLLLALIGLTVLVCKHYDHRLRCCSEKAEKPQTRDFDNQAFLKDQEDNWAPAPSPEPSSAPSEAPLKPPRSASPSPPSPKSPNPAPLSSAPESPEAAKAGDSPSAVRSILTKDRRPEGGYKAVWFGEDIGAEADVVVLNTPTTDAEGVGDSGDEGSGDEGWGPRGSSDANSTYI